MTSGAPKKETSRVRSARRFVLTAYLLLALAHTAHPRDCNLQTATCRLQGDSGTGVYIMDASRHYLLAVHLFGHEMGDRGNIDGHEELRAANTQTGSFQGDSGTGVYVMKEGQPYLLAVTPSAVHSLAAPS